MPTTQERQKAMNTAVDDVVRSTQESPDTEAQAAHTDAAEERLHEATSERAYELYLARGGEHGHDLDDWLRAEGEMRQNARSES